MPGLASVEVEVLTLIFELIDDTSPKTIASLALVNRHLYATSRLVAHRRKTLEYVWALNPNSTDTIDHWLENDDILRGLRHLTIETRGATIDDDGDDYANSDAKFDQLAYLLKKLGHLRVLVWNHDCHIPLTILDTLHSYHPKAELQIYGFQRDVQEEDENNPAEIALANSPALTAIRGSFRSNGGHPDLREACFKRIVATAPNLRFASLSRWASGCMVYGMTSEQMTELTEKEKKFYTHKKPNASLRRLTLDGYGMSDALLQHWAEFLDLSRLENIKVSAGHPGVSYFTYAPQVLTNLKHVSLNLSYLGSDNTSDAAVVEEYLTACAPLQSLSLWSWMGKVSLDGILAKHGPTLEILQLHERETVDPNNKRKTLSAADVRAIRLACPMLKELTIDCDRPNASLDAELSSNETLQELKQMNLAKLQIYYDLGLVHIANRRRVIIIDDNEGNSDDESDEEDTKNAMLPPSTPQACETHVKQLWTYIFGLDPATTTANTRTRELEVKFGEWERKMGSGYPASWVIEEANKRTRWVVRPNERDDKQGECVVQKFGTDD